ncbi:unnamed protein product [Lathyrus sativus]|nr:unnamed protein product [Lathyrus sativus]
MSKIDRFLLSDSIIERQGMMGQFIERRDISNRCPIWLKINKDDWGPKPFKTNYSWFENKDFLNYVEKEWNNIKLEGRSNFIIKEKLKILKFSLKSWNKEVFGWYDLKVEEGVEDINMLDNLLSNCDVL